jgi:PAS domain S-box-containing protein
MAAANWASRESFSRIFHLCPEPLLLARLDDGLCCECNDRFCTLFGFTRTEALGHSALPGDLGLWADPGDRDRWSAQLRASGEQADLEAPLRRRDGSIFTGHIASSLLEIDGERYHLSILRDRTPRKRAEEALLHEQTFTRALLDHQIEGVVACDDQGDLVMFNRTLCEWHGKDALRLPAEQWGEFYDLFEADGVTPLPAQANPLVRAFNGEVFQDAAVVIRARDQPLRHILANGSPIVDARHRRLGAMVVMHDVTSQRQAQEAMLKVSVAVRQSPVSVVITDARGAIEYVNPKFTEVTGYPAFEVLGQNPRILKTDHLGAQAYRELWATITAGRTWKGEFLNRKKNGDLYWEAATIAPVKDLGGSIINFVAIKEDITEHKRAEQARLESEARFRELFETSKDGIAMVDPQGRYVDCNQAYLDLLGLAAREELIARSFEAFTPDEYLHQPRSQLRAGLGRFQEENLEFEKEYLRKTGERVPVEMRVWLRRDQGGNLVGRWVIARDITERRQAAMRLEQLNGELEERVQQRTAMLEATNAELDAFSYSVSHDLRAPLRAIDGFTEILAEACGDQLNDEARHALQRVRAGTRRMGQLIDDLLRLSRAGRGDLSRKRLDLSAMAQALLADFSQGEPARSAAFRVEPGLAASGDPGLVRSVLENLLGNAWKYTSRVPEARIEFFRESQPDGSSAFCVRDNGAGFDMAYADKLFTAFQRLHAAQDFEGSGIGLAIVQRIIRRHGGRVWAKGAVAEGASFFFTLPEPGLER